MRKFRFIGDPSDYAWNVELIKNYIYNEDVELNGFLGLSATLEMCKDQDENDPILSDWEEVFDETKPLHKNTDLGHFSLEIIKAVFQSPSIKQSHSKSVPEFVTDCIVIAKELIKQLDAESK